MQSTEGASGGRELRRELGILALVATAVCTVIGGGINVLSVEIQDQLPGINGLVPLVFIIGMVPALLTALAYAVLASAMPRAGGGYIYCSRALHPYVGFIATFSKWFGLAAACGVIAYIDVPLLRAAAEYAGIEWLSVALGMHMVQLLLPLLLLWLFWLVNLVGVRTYGITVVVLMILMLLGGVVVIGVGLVNSPADYAQALLAEKGIHMNEFINELAPRATSFSTFMRGASILFFAYIGFAGISQAGGEAKEPVRTLPRSFVVAMAVISTYYVLYSAAVYHAVPWQYVARFAEVSEARISVPELMGVLMPKPLAVFVALMAGLALANDIPPMLMAVSRLFFAWAKDGLIPRRLAQVNKRFGTPHWALTISTFVASLFVIVCDLWFRQGFETVVVALLFTYVLVAASVIAFPYRNPQLYQRVTFLRHRIWQVLVAVGAMVTVGILLLTTVVNDINNVLVNGLKVQTLASATGFWLAALLLGNIVFAVMWKRRARQTAGGGRELGAGRCRLGVTSPSG